MNDERSLEKLIQQIIASPQLRVMTAHLTWVVGDDFGKVFELKIGPASKEASPNV